MGKNIFFSTRLRHFWHVSYPNMSLSAILNGFSGDTVLASLEFCNAYGIS